jgi:hypothetical protein
LHYTRIQHKAAKKKRREEDKKIDDHCLSVSSELNRNVGPNGLSAMDTLNPACLELKKS